MNQLNFQSTSFESDTTTSAIDVFYASILSHYDELYSHCCDGYETFLIDMFGYYGRLRAVDIIHEYCKNVLSKFENTLFVDYCILNTNDGDIEIRMYAADCRKLIITWWKNMGPNAAKWL